MQRTKEAAEDAYKKGAESVKCLEIKPTAEMCTQWFFDSNLKDAKKRMCK